MYENIYQPLISSNRVDLFHVSCLPWDEELLIKIMEQS